MNGKTIIMRIKVPAYVHVYFEVCILSQRGIFKHGKWMVMLYNKTIPKNIYPIEILSFELHVFTFNFVVGG